jgi:enediyne biosynthesis protein E4
MTAPHLPRRPAHRRRAALLLAASLTAAGCGGDREPAGGAATAGTEPAPPPARFVDVTEAAGIDFTHFNDATPERRLPETMGSGAAFFDYDRDGDPDLYLANGASIAGGRGGSPPGALYQNQGGGTFRHVTTVAGLDRPMMATGVAVGDVDNDGWTDLFVAGLGGDRLYRNRGVGEGGAVTFEDVSERFGLAENRGYSASAAFLDYDRDGFLDLYVARYVTWSPETDVACSPDGVHRTYCTPEVYDGAPNVLYRNTGGGGFEDVTREAGVWLPEAKSLGVVVLDHDRDGWPDLAVANDTFRNTLWHNLGRGGEGAVRFEEIGVAAGIAHSESGATRGGMGIDAGDVDADGRVDVVIGNFAQEMAALYRGREGGVFVDDAAQRGVGLPTVLALAFGTLLFDQDGDGDLDLVFVNGHIEPEIAETRPLHRYAQKPQLFENLGSYGGEDGDGEGDAAAEGGDGGAADGAAAGESREDERGRGHFVEVAPPPGDAFAEPLVGRGLAAADVDLDGDLDLVITQSGGPARLYENRADPASWLRVRLEGTRSNRTGYGATVRVVAGGRTSTRTLVSGRSYLSASEPVLTFGLDGADSVDRVEVIWPSGTEQVVDDVELNTTLTIEEPGGGGEGG